VIVLYDALACLNRMLSDEFACSRQHCRFLLDVLAGTWLVPK
jgi:hypothetical protein